VPRFPLSNRLDTGRAAVNQARMERERVIVVGAGVGGLAAALTLVARGVEVTVVERAATSGGKLREVEVGGVAVDAGPSVFTMRHVFDELFAAAGLNLADHLALTRARTLARHAWGDARLDLFADPAQSEAAIGAFAGAAEARGFRAFRAEAKRMFDTLWPTFMNAPTTDKLGLMRRIGLTNLPALLAIRPYQTLWHALGQHFRDPRLRQLFGRYATYTGSSPFEAPATLMLIAHVEMGGVWLVEGGMRRIATALETAARAKGAAFRFGEHVAEILVGPGGAHGVRLASGERLHGRVVLNADPAALTAGNFGPTAARAIPPQPAATRSFSALTWMARATTRGFPLVRHNVFFGGDYSREFADLARGRLPTDPSVYVCAQDRDDHGGTAPPGPERLQFIVNAPANGGQDQGGPTSQEIEQCQARLFTRLMASGLTIGDATLTRTGPREFDQLYPSTGGALYGPASHGSAAAFRRPGSRTRIPGLYLAGGATHPGAGVPMAALSGRLAASALLQDLASTFTSARKAMRGGMSTRQATAAATA